MVGLFRCQRRVKTPILRLENDDHSFAGQGFVDHSKVLFLGRMIILHIKLLQVMMYCKNGFGSRKNHEM